MQINQVIISYSTTFLSNMMIKDISANLYQKCLILCSKILLDVLHKMSVPVLSPWQHTGFQNYILIFANGASSA